jgi:uncharacterized Zn finger protein (UPF0148 family)
MLHKETMKQDTTCPTCGLYWTREDNEDCPRCDTCNRLRIEQLEGQLSEAKAEIARLSADLEAANRETLTAQNENKVLHSSNNTLRSRTNSLTAQLEAANTIINAWVRHSPMCSILIKPSCDCGLHAALSSYRRSPDSNTETRR